MSSMPPKPLHVLSQLLPELPPALAAVAEWLLRHPVQAATGGIKDVAQGSGSSLAAVTRLAHRAGYPGYPELRAELAIALRETLDPIHKLQGALDGKFGDAKALLSAQIASGCRQLELVGCEPNDDALGQLARQLLNARRVYVLAFGKTAYYSLWLSDMLEPYVSSVRALGGVGGTERSAARLASANEQDVVLALSFPRYSNDILRLASFARQRCAWLAGVVDSRAAPLASKVDLALIAPSQHSQLPASMVACQALLEALVAEVMRLHPQAKAEAMKHTAAVFPHLVGNVPPNSL